MSRKKTKKKKKSTGEINRNGVTKNAQLRQLKILLQEGRCPNPETL